MPACRKRSRAIEDSDVIEPKEATLKDVGSIRIFAIDPPREIQKQFVKDFFQKATVGGASHATLNFVHAPCRPCVNGRIHIAERPFVSGKLAVRMHVPLTKQENELFFGEIGVN